jgi:hypothetical protein
LYPNVNSTIATSRRSDRRTLLLAAGLATLAVGLTAQGTTDAAFLGALVDFAIDFFGGGADVGGGVAVGSAGGFPPSGIEVTYTF